MGWLRLIGVGVLLAAMGGCRTGARRRAEMVGAIDEFYVEEPACLWFEPVETPMEVDAADTAGRAGLDALVDQGLLARTVVDADAQNGAGVRYELTPTGRKAWHAEVGHAGFGNICYGVTKVVEVGSVVAQHDGKLGDVTDVAYLTELRRQPVWTMSPAVKEAFPRLEMELTGRMAASARLQERNGGWVVVGAPTHTLTSSTGGQVEKE